MNNLLELYSVPIAGGSPSVLLNGAMPAAGDVTLYVLAPDGKRVAYVADQDADEVFELFWNTADGSLGSLQVNDPLVGGGDVLGGIRFDPDGRRLYFLADADANDVVELYVSEDLGL